MRKKKVLKQAVALTLALGISLSGSLVAYADSPYIHIEPSATYQSTGESKTFTDDLMGITYQISVNELSDVNATFTINREKTRGVDTLSQIEYGYLEGDKFVKTYTNESIYHLNQDNAGNLNGVYPIFDKTQVQKDQLAGITDRVYVLIIDGLNNATYSDNFIPFLFKLSGTTAPSITAGWVQDTTGWWYQNADGSYPINAWKEINSKQYYFGADGYMLHDTTTPDGYTVGSDGAWIENSLSDENTLQKLIEPFVELYVGAFYIDEAEFERNVKSFYPDPVEAEIIINEIRSNHTFVPDTF